MALKYLRKCILYVYEFSRTKIAIKSPDYHKRTRICPYIYTLNQTRETIVKTWLRNTLGNASNVKTNHIDCPSDMNGTQCCNQFNDIFNTRIAQFSHQKSIDRSCLVLIHIQMFWVSVKRAISKHKWSAAAMIFFVCFQCIFNWTHGARHWIPPIMPLICLLWRYFNAGCTKNFAFLVFFPSFVLFYQECQRCLKLVKNDSKCNPKPNWHLIFPNPSLSLSLFFSIHFFPFLSNDCH